MASPAPKPLTVDQFLASLPGDDERVELVDGVITAMVGGTANAHRIGGNIFAALFNKLRGGQCTPFGDGMLVRVDEHTAFAPDVSVVCTPFGGRDRYLVDPVVIVEVLSPSTESHDRFVKWLRYQTMPSLRHFLLVAQDQPVVESFWRERAGPWTYDSFRDDRSLGIELAAIDTTVSLAEIYEGVDLAT